VSSPLDLWPSDFEVPDELDEVVVDCDWLAPLAAALLPLLLAGSLGFEPALDGGALFALLESLFAGGGFDGPLLLAGAALLLALLAGGGLLLDGGGAASALLCDGGGGGAAWLSFDVFWLTRFPKRSLAGVVAARVSHEGAD
jgi:hypothetical protein